MSVKIIKEFMLKNNLTAQSDVNEVMKLVEITKMYKNEKGIYEITMKGPKNSYYEGGIYDITIDMENNNKGRPEIRILQKIYHLNVSPNGHVSGYFINQWEKNFTIIHALIGIYLYLKLCQNPFDPYDGKMAFEYQSNIKEFERKARLWTLQYATGKNPQNEIKIIIEIKKKCEKAFFYQKKLMK